MATAVIPAQALAQCEGADHQPTAASAKADRTAVICLVNERRRAAHVRRLTQVAALDTAAAAYSKRLVAQHFFSHFSPGGGSVEGRVGATGYFRGTSDYMVGENLGWGTGIRGTPASMVASWMASPGHRQTMLMSDFRHVGAGVTYGTPIGAIGATYSVVFGDRVLVRTKAHTSCSSKSRRGTAKCRAAAKRNRAHR